MLDPETMQRLMKQFEPPKPEPPTFSKMLFVVSLGLFTSIISIGLFLWACRQIKMFFA